MRTRDRVKRLEQMARDVSQRAELRDLSDEALMDIIFDGHRWRTMTEEQREAEVKSMRVIWAMPDAELERIAKGGK